MQYARRLSPGPDPVGQVRDRAGPEGDVDVRVEVEDPLALRLGVAAADRDHLLRVALLERRGLREVRREALVGLLADGAGVEDEDVRLLLSGGLAEPQRLQHALDALGVVRVHLTPERRDEIPLHARKLYRRFRSSLDTFRNPCDPCSGSFVVFQGSCL
jgi:hypothetical protein